MTPAAVTVPPAVTRAEAKVIACWEQLDAIEDTLAGQRRQLDALRESVRETEERKASALLHLDVARRNADLARQQAAGGACRWREGESAYERQQQERIAAIRAEVAAQAARRGETP
jgi:hypothetical protein